MQVARGAGLPARALVTDMNQVSGWTQAPRLRALTLGMAAAAVVLQGMSLRDTAPAGLSWSSRRYRASECKSTALRLWTARCPRRLGSERGAPECEHRHQTQTQHERRGRLGDNLHVHVVELKGFVAAHLRQRERRQADETDEADGVEHRITGDREILRDGAPPDRAPEKVSVALPPER